MITPCAKEPVIIAGRLGTSKLNVATATKPNVPSVTASDTTTRIVLRIRRRGPSEKGEIITPRAVINSRVHRRRMLTPTTARWAERAARSQKYQQSLITRLLGTATGTQHCDKTREAFFIDKR